MHGLNQSIAIGPLGLSIGQLLLVLAFSIALLAGALIRRRHRTPTADTLFTLLFVALVGARLVFVAGSGGGTDGPRAMLAIRDGGFDPLGGLVAGVGYAL